MENTNINPIYKNSIYYNVANYDKISKYIVESNIIPNNYILSKNIIIPKTTSKKQKHKSMSKNNDIESMINKEFTRITKTKLVAKQVINN